VDDTGFASSVIASASASVSGNTIALSVAKSAHAALSSITSSTGVSFSTYYHDGTVSAGDSYPDF
jgi:hypothetical protein